jgi:hypothetical protein
MFIDRTPSVGAAFGSALLPQKKKGGRFSPAFHSS